MGSKERINICWFRRDLRLHDNAAMYHALKRGVPVLPVFVFDTNILDDLERKDARVDFIVQELNKIHHELVKKGSGFRVFHSTPAEAFKTLMEEYDIGEVFTNHDYESYARERDEIVGQLLQSASIAFHMYKDQVIFDRSEVVKKDDTPYLVYTPYSRAWKSKLNDFYIQAYPVEKYFKHLYQFSAAAPPGLTKLGFEKTNATFPSRDFTDLHIRNYDKERDFPALRGTSRIGIHLRFGTVSIRELVAYAKKQNQVYLNELIWREFYMMILWHFPHVAKGYSFRKEFDKIKWRNNEKEFESWCKGETGYPLVDAGMRELNETGFMHNRVRMVTASFLAKHLLIDWRWGEAYFASKLLDYEFASNNGGWQWSAGSGCDAAPYFRVFNPMLQAKRFDAKGEYIRKWVPEFNSLEYRAPIVEHEFARKRALAVYAKAVRG